MKMILGLALLLISLPGWAALGGTFTATPLTGNAPLSVKLDWNVTGGTAATVCTAAGSWTGTKPLSGSLTVTNLLNDATYGLSCVTPAIPGTPGVPGSATLRWNAPTLNTDGTPLTNLAGYTILYGTSATTLTQSISVNNPSVVTYVVDSLSDGPKYFAVKAFTSAGIESANSNVASKTIVGIPSTPGVVAQNWAKTILVDVNAQPQAPVLVIDDTIAYRINLGNANQVKLAEIGRVPIGKPCKIDMVNGKNVIADRQLLRDKDGKKIAPPLQVLAGCRELQPEG